MKLRLDRLHNMISREYAHIWDCCCDHGLLGTALLNSHSRSMLHFVDNVAPIISQLRQQLLSEHGQYQERYRLYCMDAGRVQLAKTQDKQLVILAGVGGDLCAELVVNILTANPEANVDLLLNPVHHSYKLRRQLQQLELTCLNELLIEENQRFYEALLVTKRQKGQALVSATGTGIWQANNPTELAVCQRYLAKLISHYQRMCQGTNPQAKLMLEAYQQLELGLKF